MASMSANSGDFKTPGSEVGLEIWRIENLHAVPVEKKSYGAFHTGDCYIILNTYEDKYGKRSMDLFYWLGEKSSQDERGGVAYKAVELDDMLGGKPVQHREVQGHESPLMQSLFPDGIRYLEGGVDSAFRHVDPSAYKPRLFHLKGKRNVRVQQVELKSSSLNEGDVFILDAGLNLYQWNGKEANKYEKAKGLELITKINGDERGAKAKLHFLDSGRNDDPEFWKLLGGKSGVKGANEVPSDDEVKAAVAQLFSHDGQLLGQGALDRSLLSTEGTYLIDSGTELFVWIGKGAPAEARRTAMEQAQQFLKANSRPDWTPVTRVPEGGEQPALKALFKQWDPPRVVDMKQPEAKKQAEADYTALYKAQQAAQEKLVDDGSGKLTIWRIENFNKVELDRSMYGQFYAGDSYLLLYQYRVKGRDNAIIYFWQGRASSQDEKGTSALLAKGLFDDLHGQATQVRVVQNKEPNHFFTLFKGKMVVHEGGKAGAFKNRHESDSYHAGETALYHVRGTNEFNTHAVQVHASAESLNSGDCFVLGTPAAVFVWQGVGSSDDEKKVASSVADLLSSGRPVSVVPEGQEPDAFWEALGGKADYPSTKAMETGQHEARLFQCSNSGAGFKVSEVFNFSQEDLVHDDVMLLDAYSEVYVWIGHESNQQEKELSVQAALNYVKNAPDGRDPDTPVFVVNAGQELPSFTCYFLGWDYNKAQDFTDPYAKKLAALKSSGAAAPSPVAASSEHKAPVARSGSVIKVTSLADAGLKFLDPSTNVFTAVQLKAGQNGVDPKNKEQYLSADEFKKLFGVSKEEFNAMPSWKKEQGKKKAGLF
jgi:advillin